MWTFSDDKKYELVMVLATIKGSAYLMGLTLMLKNEGLLKSCFNLDGRNLCQSLIL